MLIVRKLVCVNMYNKDKNPLLLQLSHMPVRYHNDPLVECCYEYRRTSHSSYTLLWFVHPPFPAKDANFHTRIYSYTNYYFIVRTAKAQAQRDGIEVRFCFFLLLVSILQPGMPWIKAGVPTSQSRKLHPSQCHMRLVSVHILSLHKSTSQDVKSKSCGVCH